jgi:hypothetical protein
VNGPGISLLLQNNKSPPNPQVYATRRLGLPCRKGASEAVVPAREKGDKKETIHCHAVNGFSLCMLPMVNTGEDKQPFDLTLTHVSRIIASCLSDGILLHPLTSNEISPVYVALYFLIPELCGIPISAQ